VDLLNQDRLMLIHEFRILAFLDEENADGHLRRATILQEGYAGEYYDIFSGIAEELSPEECHEVADTLVMYSELQHAHELMREKISAKEVLFPGYGGDNEDRQRSYCKFFIQDNHNFLIFSVLAQNADFRSPTSNVDMYRRMLTVWRAVNKCAQLTAEQARAILNAGQERGPTHSNRP
jgi:uncharacterized protein YfbU (UPF0304 family)